jgi:glutamate carboxypeptidase
MHELLEQLEAMLPDGVRLLERLVELESPSYDAEDVNELVQLLAAEFEQLGGAITRIPEPNRGDHLVIRFPGESSRPIMLLGHTDTVWPKGTLAERPFTVEGDVATGPGVFDMKAGIVMMWMTIRAVLKVRGRLAHPVCILLISNEEVGSPGSRALVTSEAAGMRAVLVLEPPLPGGVLKTRRNGMARFVVRAFGREAHSGINPEEGINAVEEVAHQILRIQKLGDAAKKTFVTATVIEGGTRPNVVPAECTLQVDARTPSAAEATRVTHAIRSLQPVLPGSSLKIDGEFKRPPLEPTPGNVELFGLAQETARALGYVIEGGATGGTSDGNLTSAMGVPTLDGLGAVGSGAHQIDEQIQLSSLPWRAALVAGIMEKIEP